MRYYVNRTTPTLSPMESIFNDLFGDTQLSRRIPPVDIYETEDGYVIEASVAGYDEKDISLSVDKRVLTLSTLGAAEDDEEKKEEKKVEKKYLMREIPRPTFSRSFTLPEDVDDEKISAENKNGILYIELPRLEKLQKGKIEIKIK